MGMFRENDIIVKQTTPLPPKNSTNPSYGDAIMGVGNDGKIHFLSATQDASGKWVLDSNATISGDVNVDNTSLDMSGYVGKAGATNADFSTAYASSTSIQLADLPSDITAFTADDIASVVQINSGGLVVKTYTRDDSTMTITGTNVLNVADASFSSGDSFIVYTNVARPGAAGADNITAEYMSPDDFTATYLSSTTITLSGLDFEIKDDSQIVGIKVVSSLKETNIYKAGINGVTITANSNVLTISGAGSPFASGDVYTVGINAQKKAYNSGTNSDMVSQLNSDYNHYTSTEHLIDSTNVAAGTNRAVFDFESFKHGVLQLKGSGGVTFTLFATLDDTADDSSDAGWIDVTNKVFGAASIVDSEVIGFIDTAMMPDRFMVKYVTSDSSNAVDAWIKKGY